MVTRFSEHHFSHSSARRTNRSVGIRCWRTPAYIIIRWKPISPMSCVSGIQLSETSLSENPAAWRAPSALARMLRCVSTTPLGSLVEPDENWMNAVCSGVTSAGVPAREMSSSASIRKVRGSSAVHASGSPLVAAKVASRSRSLRSVYSSGWPSCRAIRSSLCLCSSLMPDRHRHRHDAAVQAGPVGVDELLVARDVQDQVIAGAGADPLQVEQDAERAPAQVRESQRLLRAFALEVDDRAVAAGAVVEHVRGASDT